MWRYALESCGQSGACSTGRNHANVPGRRRGAVFGARRALLAPPHPVAGHLTARGMPPGPIFGGFLILEGNYLRHFFIHLTFCGGVVELGADGKHGATGGGRGTRHRRAKPLHEGAERGAAPGQCRHGQNLK